MEPQPSFDFGLAPISGERKEPRLWVKEFGFFSDFKPDKEVRRISLRKGLNIIWAAESESGAAGHAAGKSTFCRLLRYLIGDVTFGSEVFRPALRNKFPNAIIGGEVILNGEPWLICRPLSESGYHWCAKGKTYNDLFEDGFKRNHYDDFISATEFSFIKPLGVSQYPSSDKEIIWQHLLQWLSRDQDARYSANLQWRPANDPNPLTSTEKTNLVRLVLGLLSDTELTMQKDHSKHLSVRAEIKTLLPKLQFARDRSIQELAVPYPDLGKRGCDYESKLTELIATEKKKADALKIEFDRANLHDGVGEVLTETLRQKESDKRKLERELDAARTNIQRNLNQQKYRKGKLSKEQLKAQNAKLGDIEGKCSESIDAAIAAGCPLAPSLNRDDLAAARLDDAKNQVTNLVSNLTTLQLQRKRIRSEIKNAEQLLKPLRKQIEDKKQAHSKQRTKLSEQHQASKSLHEKLENTLEDTELMAEKRKEQKTLDAAIDNSSKALKDERAHASSLLSTLSNDFSWVATHITNQKTTGSVKFNSDGIDSTLNYDGDISSAAFVTLRLLIFDLACLLGSVRTTSHHPGFLLHDSPREADLSVHIYRRLFTLIAGTEEPSKSENESVQYIIATTEAPPKHLQSRPWLGCAPLSSADPGSRLLKKII